MATASGAHYAGICFTPTLAEVIPTMNPLAHPSQPALNPRPDRTLLIVTRALLSALLAALLGACAALPPRGLVEPSQALPASQASATTLARIAAASLPPGADAPNPPSGFQPLPTGEFAFGARVALMARAERALDLQIYHLHRDQAGMALLRELRDAAVRGVRVRLLVDDLYAVEIDDLLCDLAAHAGVQVRLFNPLPLRWGTPVWRLLASPGDFELHNHRMHNKLFLADNAVAIFGGRNIADEYFMGHAEANFIDMDLLATGAVVQDLSAVFDRYWNSDAAWPVQALRGAPAATAAQARFDAAVRDAALSKPPYRTDPHGQTAVQDQLDLGQLALHYASASVFTDPPAKASTPAGKAPTEAMRGLLAALATARREVRIVSPYFVPGEVGMPMMREAARYGVQTVLITNSLGSTDEPLVHDKYSAYRVEMLRIGVQIHEFSPALTRRSQGFGNFGRSTPRLHAKVALVDQRLVLVGSVNLDGRSAVGNTEMGVVIDSPALAAEMKQLVSGERLGNLYRLSLLADRSKVQWSWPDGQGGSLSTTDEPDSSPALRFKLWLQSLVVEERLL